MIKLEWIVLEYVVLYKSLLDNNRSHYPLLTSPQPR
jgi:hypothetical protein